MTDENSIETDLAKQRIARQKCLVRLVVVDDMPMTPARKIIKEQPRLPD